MAVLLILFTFAMGFVYTAVNVFVVFKIWGWYFPMLFGGPSLSVAFGVSLVARVLSSVEYKKPDPTAEWSDLVVVLLGGLIAPFLILFVGWVGTFFF